MKRFTASAAALLLLGLSASTAQAGIGFRVTGGFTHISYSDYNDMAEELNKGFAGLAEVDKINWIPEFGGEFYYSLIPSLDVGIGASIMMGKSDLSYSDLAGSIEAGHNVKSFPITATVYFRPSVPLVSLKPYLYGGTGVYYSRITFDLLISDGTDSMGYDAELTDWGYGLHGGGGFEFSIAPTVSLDIGFRLRWADMKGFEGTATSYPDGETIDVFLIGDTIEGDWVYDIGREEDKGLYEEGSVNLSGYSFYLGIKAGF